MPTISDRIHYLLSPADHYVITVTREYGVEMRSVASVCLFCLRANFRKPLHRNFAFDVQVHLQNI